jgi:DNA-binding NarL/FixJ family response regulator
MSIKILIADDHKMVREGLKTLLDKQVGMKVVGEASNGIQAVRLALELNPEVVIMDITMPDLNGIEATRRINAKKPGIKVIALSMHSDRRFMEEVLKNGASGYLLKDSAFDELAVAIRTVSKNQTYLSSQLADLVLKDYVSQLSRREPNAYSKLTPREREVLQMLAEGHTTKQVSIRLHVSIKTVETHRKQLMDKLDIHSIAGLTKYAIREGITKL